MKAPDLVTCPTWIREQWELAIRTDDRETAEAAHRHLITLGHADLAEQWATELTPTHTEAERRAG
jgi:DNA-binding LacI/PurR family transcriptional regulator